jgi:hypothetical protein
MVLSSDVFNAKVLIVDDLEADVLLLERMLRSAGYASIQSPGTRVRSTNFTAKTITPSSCSISICLTWMASK